MATIGFLPTKTTMQVREPDGDGGTIPAATRSAAGVMTAQHVEWLESLWRRSETSGAGVPVIIERPVDTSQFLTRPEARQLLQQIPRMIDVTPDVRALQNQVVSLHERLSESEATRLMLAPPTQGEAVDTRARRVLDGILSGMEQIDLRLQAVEQAIETLRSFATANDRAA